MAKRRRPVGHVQFYLIITQRGGGLYSQNAYLSANVLWKVSPSAEITDKVQQGASGIAFNFSIPAATALNIYVAVSNKRAAADHPTCREALEALKEETTSTVYLNVTASISAGGAVVLLLVVRY